jgi:hypothetical protein
LILEAKYFPVLEEPLPKTETMLANQDKNKIEADTHGTIPDGSAEQGKAVTVGMLINNNQ